MKFTFTNRNKDKMSDAWDVGGKIVANRDTWVIVPDRYKALGMITFGITINVGGLFWLTDGTYGSVSRIPGTFEFKPATIESTTIDGVQHVVLYFPKGHVVSNSDEVLMLKDSMFGALTETFLRGKPPIFATPEDIRLSMNLGPVYSDPKFSGNEKTIEVLLSIITRSAKDPYKFARSMPDGSPVVFKGLSNMEYGYNNAAAKLTHNYFTQGVTSTIANHGKLQPTRQDNILADIR